MNWKKGSLCIVYENPQVTPFKGVSLGSMKDVMYFYYDIKIFDDQEVIFSSRTQDSPKVQVLPQNIQCLLDMKEEDMFLREDFNQDGFHRKNFYHFVELDDEMDIDYFYKLEKSVTFVKQAYEEDYNRWEEYTLTVGQSAPSKGGYSNGENFGKSVFIKYLTRDDLVSLRDVADIFCQIAAKGAYDECHQSNE